MRSKEQITKMNLNLLDTYTSNSKSENMVLTYVIKNVSNSNELLNKSTKKPITITELSKLVSVSRPDTLKAISTLAKKNSILIVLNPNLYVPHNISYYKLFILQTWYDSDFTYGITDELDVANNATEAYLKANRPKGV